MTSSKVAPVAPLGRGGQGLLAAAALSGLMSCSPAEKERPPYGGCTGTACGDGDGGGVIGNNPGSSAGGQGGASSVGSDLTGGLLAYTDDTFAGTIIETGVGKVYGEPVDSIGWVEAIFDGTSYALEGVKQGKTVWMGAASADTAKFLLTFGLQDTTKAKVDVPLARVAVLDDIFAVAAVSDTPLSTAAQVFVRIVDAGGSGVSGVSVISSQQAFVAYSDGNQTSWSTGVAQTTTDGVALLGNVATKVMPGIDVTLTLSGAVTATIDVPTAAGAVTVLRASP